MSGSFRLFECHYGAETSFAEAVTTYTGRIPILSYTLTTTQERIRDGALLSRENDENLSHLGPKSAELEFTTYLIGHLTTAADVLVQTWLQDLLSDGWGGGDTAGTGSTISGGSSSATSINIADKGGFLAGGIVRVGVKGDARGDGAPAVISTVTEATPDVLALLTGLPAAPTTAGDVVYGCQFAYRDETATLATKRFMIGYSSTPTTGAQYHLRGGGLAGVTFDFPVATGGLPTVTLKYLFADWVRSAVTIPSTSPTLSDDFCGPCAGGSFFRANFGTATRTTITPANVKFSTEMSLQPIPGPGGVGANQWNTGWALTKCQPVMTVDLPWTTTEETSFDTANQSYTYQHLLFATNHSDGRHVSIYMPRAFRVGNRPSQPIEVNGQLYTTNTYVGRDSTTTDTQLTRSPFRLAMG